MTKRALLVLWILAAALGVAVFSVKSKQNRASESTTARSRGQTLFETFPADKVASIQINSADSSVNLAKGDKGWTVKERASYPANVTKINEMLRTLGEVKVTQGIEADESFAPRFGMDPKAKKAEDHGLHLVFRDAAGAELAKVALGKNLEAAGASQNPMMSFGGTNGRFIRNAADTTGIYVASETFPTVAATPKDWLGEDFIKVEKVKSIRMGMPAKADFKPWTLVRDDENAEFKLEGIAADETLDTTATSPLKSVFSYARFEDVVEPDKATPLKDSANERVATLETVEGFTYTLSFAPKKNDAAAPEPKKEGPDAAAPSDESYLLTVKVDAKLATERKKEANEKPEDAKTKDEAFQKRIGELKTQLEKEKALEGRVFEVTRWTVDALLKERSALVKKAETPPAPAPATTPGQPAPGTTTLPVTPMPTPGVTAPGAAPATPGDVTKPAEQPKRIEAVTPPIAVPPLEESTPPKTDSKPAEPAPPAEPAKPADSSKPAETPPPADPAKPAGS